MKVVYTLLLLSFAVSLSAQSAHKHLRTGDQRYKSESFTEAEESYRKSLQEKKSSNGSFNLGNSIYQQQRFEEAAGHYEQLAESSNDTELQADAYHNLGNAKYQLQDFEGSVDAYKNALKLRPKDMETKVNLAQALKQMKIQQQQQQQQQNNENENEEEQEQEQQQQQQEQPQQQDQQQQVDDKNQEEQEQDQQQQQDLTKEEAAKLLEIMEEEEKKVQEKLKKGQNKPNKSKKDW